MKNNLNDINYEEKEKKFSLFAAVYFSLFWNIKNALSLVLCFRTYLFTSLLLLSELFKNVFIQHFCQSTIKAFLI